MTSLETPVVPSPQAGAFTRAEAAVAVAVFLLLPVSLVAYDARFHEFWRDEAQACLIGVNVPISQFFSFMQIEGVPFLFHLLMKVLGVLLPPLPTLLAAGFLGFEVLLFGSYRLLLSISGERLYSLLAVLVLSFTYTYAYELGVVVRQYGMALGFAMLTMAYLRDALRTGERPYVVAGAVACALGALSSAHAACVCAAAVLAYGLSALVRRSLTVRAVATLATVAPAFGVGVWLAMPRPDRPNTSDAIPRSSLDEFFRLAHQAVAGSFTPQDWWVATSFGDPHTLDRLALLRSLAPSALAIGAAVALVSLGPKSLRIGSLVWFDLLAVVVSWVPLSVVVIDHYWGSPRHHLTFSVPAVAVTFGWILRSRWRRWLALFAVPYLGFEIALGVTDLGLDIDQPFSDTKRIAAALPANAHVVADSFTMSESLLVYRPDILLRGKEQRGQRARYVTYDTHRAAEAPLGQLIGLECAEAPDRVFYVGGGGGNACTKRLVERTPHTEQLRTDEQFDLSQVDCACLTGSGGARR